jgi:uracil-DNA glycosylase
MITFWRGTKKTKIIVPLGQIAFIQTLKSLRMQGLEIPPLAFGHGKIYPLPNGQMMITTYHPSQQNTQTGKLTKPMFHKIFEMVQKRIKN